MSESKFQFSLQELRDMKLGLQMQARTAYEVAINAVVAAATRDYGKAQPPPEVHWSDLMRAVRVREANLDARQSTIARLDAMIAEMEAEMRKNGEAMS